MQPRILGAMAGRTTWHVFGRTALIAVFLIALVPRLLIAGTFTDPPTTANDAGWYDAFGRGIAHGDGYILPDGSPTSRWPPGYPAFVGAVYKATGDSRDALRVAQAVIGALTAVLVVELGRRLMSPAAGIAAGLVVAFTPSHALYSALLMSEVLFTALMVGAMLLALRRSVAACAAAGVLLGCATSCAAGVLLARASCRPWIAYGHFIATSGHRPRAAGRCSASMTPGAVDVRNAFTRHIQRSTNLASTLWVGTPSGKRRSRTAGDRSTPRSAACRTTGGEFDRSSVTPRSTDPATPRAFVRRAPRKEDETGLRLVVHGLTSRSVRILSDAADAGDVSASLNLVLLVLVRPGSATLARSNWRALCCPLSLLIWSAV